jgi:hypothetical protein
LKHDTLSTHTSNSLITDELEATGSSERRGPQERRQRTLLALLLGSFHARRRMPRRMHDTGIAHVDWHDARWLAVGVLILLLSSTDAILTLMLLDHGAAEINPLMAPLVGGTSRAFVLWKVALTAGGVVLLTLLVRMRAFGRFPAGLLLYMVLLAYSGLVGYEFWLLDSLAPAL